MKTMTLLEARDQLKNGSIVLIHSETNGLFRIHKIKAMRVPSYFHCKVETVNDYFTQYIINENQTVTVIEGDRL